MHDTAQLGKSAVLSTKLRGEVHEVTYKNSTDFITIEEALRLYEYGVCVIVDEGQHVTLVDED